MSYAFLPLSTVLRAEPVARRKRVAGNAYARDGIVAAYRLAGGSSTLLGGRWKKRRERYVAISTSKMLADDRRLWDETGQPTREHLALIMWAYSPDPVGVAMWIKERS